MECGNVGEHYETRTFIPFHPSGIALPRTAWVRLNHLRTGVGRLRSNLHKLDMAASGLVSVAKMIKPLIMLSSNVHFKPSTSPWIAQPDGSG